MKASALNHKLRVQLAAAASEITVFGVKYLHLPLENGSDLYVTRWGRPFLRQLMPENHWADGEWAEANREKLPGTSSLYRMRTKEVDGVSKEIVLKWNRMGQEIPGETRATDLATAEFNSPFEEFGLVNELRNRSGADHRPLSTHKPLAIFVPRKLVDLERTGRKSWRIEKLVERHKEVTLDPKRNYAVLYEWIKGIDAAEAAERELIEPGVAGELLAESNRRLTRRGFRINDNKPHHLIVRPREGGEVLADRDGDILFALVDFELLERTPQHEQRVRASRRRTYLSRQPRRFERNREFPPALSPVSMFGVDYVFGRVESSTGALWVVGDDPVLFDYFLPAKWRRTPRSSLSESGRVYETTTKDAVHLVWRRSRVGQSLPADASRKARRHGYNSPFEEVSAALELSRRGVEATYPRAIYMSSHQSDSIGPPADGSRYDTHSDRLTPAGHPILSPDHHYIILWGYWNGPDELLAAQDNEYYRPINARLACEENRITPESLDNLLVDVGERMARAGIEALQLRADHLLLSIDTTGRIVTDDRGLPQARICSFDLLRPT
jgi:hypothetical protein